MAEVIVFDLNETLLDLSDLDSFFVTVFGEAESRFEWFQTLEGIMLTSILLKEGKSFSELSLAALAMTADKRAVEIFPEHETNLTQAMGRLFAYPEVKEGLEMLSEAGFRLAALTNGSAATAKKQVEFAQLADYFEAVLSAEDSGDLKPSAAAYEYAANQLDVETSEILLVAAHVWEIAGAIAAGCDAAFIARPNKILNPAGKPPKFYGSDLIEVARQIVED